MLRGRCFSSYALLTPAGAPMEESVSLLEFILLVLVGLLDINEGNGRRGGVRPSLGTKISLSPLPLTQPQSSRCFSGSHQTTRDHSH